MSALKVRWIAAVFAIGVLVAPIHAQILGVNQTITVVDSGTACVTAPTACATFVIDNSTPAVTLNVSGTWTGTLTFEASNDDTLFATISAINLATGAPATTTTANGMFGINNPGVTKVRARATAAITGSALVTAAKGQGLARNYSTPAGAGTATYKSGGVIYQEFPNIGNAADTNFVSNTPYNIPANTLTTNGDVLRFEAIWSLSSDAGTKTLQCNINYTNWTAAGGFTGGINLFSYGTTSASQTVSAMAILKRTAATTGDMVTQGLFTVLGSWVGGNNYNGAFTWANPIPVLCHGKDASGVAGGMTLKHVRIMYEPAPS
jgi:hypothetical protein